MLANPTARQRVDRSSPFYKRSTNHQCGIPHRGSVWIVQVLSTKTRTNPHARESHRGSVWILQVLSTKSFSLPLPARFARGGE